MHPWLPELTTVGRALPGRRLILDGELVALVDGRPSIAVLQQRMRTRRPTATSTPVLLAVFDLLFLDDELLIRRPYRQRRALLEDLELPAGAFQVVPTVVGAGQAMLAAVFHQDLEGVVSKRLDSPYRPGVRSRDWRKILARRRMRVLVGGFIPAAAGVGGLLVGEPDPATGRLRFLGRVDHGFTPRTRADLAAVLTPLVIDRSPFAGPVGWGGGWGRPPGPPPRWVRLIVEVAVEHIGQDPTSGLLRHPSRAEVLDRR